ncbi:MAG: hypothetical protein LUC92_08635 [Clostridiales bacterium]|nr:hypothetical protein [Clostridiales bacterium]
MNILKRLKRAKERKYITKNNPATGIYPRKLARCVARYRLQRSGYTKVNRILSAKWQKAFIKKRIWDITAKMKAK